MCIAEHLLASGALEAARQICADLLTHPDIAFEHRVLAAARLAVSGGAATPTDNIAANPHHQQAAITALADALHAFA